MKRAQRGMTLLGFLIVLAVAGVFIYMGMKVVPMYLEYYSVKDALRGLAADPDVEGASVGKVEDLFFRRLDISYADSVKNENVKVERRDAGFVVIVDYEIRKPLIANLDIVGRFKAEQEIRRTGGN